MHAGHTPSHSLSSLATNASSGTATATSNGGDSTPTMQQPDDARYYGQAPEKDRSSEASPAASNGHDQLRDDHPEPIFEPSEDRELKGPLMLRNMPAHDEIFFQKLADKLEEVSKGDDEAALPAVLKDSERTEHSRPQAERQSDAQQGPGAKDSGVKTDKSSPGSSDEEKADIPLKFKTRMNFGAPFGAMR
jgi:hypothetical protein